MRYGPVFLVLGLVLAAAAFSTPEWWARVLFGSAAVSFVLVGAAYLGGGPGLFFKRPDGRLSLLSYLLHWPYHVLNSLALLAVRLGRERAYDEIAPGLYLGRQPTVLDRAQLRKLGIRGVLDLTCEFSELPELRKLPGYRCLPLLDTGAPTGSQLDEGVRCIREAVREGPVLVHCALGHGRSATFICAYLIDAGLVASPGEAHERVKKTRPGVELSRAQMRALEYWLYPPE